MGERDPLFVPNSTSPTDARIALGGLMGAGAGGVDVRTGALYGPAVFNVTGTSGMSYSVAGGVAISSRGASVGPYLGSNDGAATVTTTAAPGSGSRYDVIYLLFADVEQGDSDSHAVFGVAHGTASGSPSEPSIPTGAVRIAKALVPSGVTRTDTGVTITKDVRYTAARGAPIPVRSSAERDELTKYAGLVARRLDTELDEITDGSSWSTFGALTVAGQTAPLSVKYGSSVATTTVNGNITVATGLTSVAIFVAMNGDAAAHDNLVASIVRPNSGGDVSVKATQGDTGNPIASSSVRYDWIAIGTA